MQRGLYLTGLFVVLHSLWMGQIRCIGQAQPAWWSGSPSHATPGWKPPTKKEAYEP
jgi:hypothetical protein